MYTLDSGVTFDNTSTDYDNWENEEMEILVKAVNLYPPGTVKR